MPAFNPARHKAIQAAQEVLARRPVYLDTETTGIGPTAEIVEISIIDTDGDTLLDTLVRPTQPIPPDAARIHGITNAMVHSAPTWSEVWPAVSSALQDRALGIYNADFDLRLMRQSHRLVNLPWRDPGLDAFCIMKLYARFYGQFNARTGDYRWVSLENAGRQCRLALPNAHRAFADALLARAVLEHIAQAAP